MASNSVPCGSDVDAAIESSRDHRHVHEFGDRLGGEVAEYRERLQLRVAALGGHRGTLAGGELLGTRGGCRQMAIELAHQGLLLPGAGRRELRTTLLAAA